MFHVFNPYFADSYGVYEALVFQHIYYWCEENMHNRRNFHDGSYWTFNTYDAFTEIFFYFSSSQVRRILSSLEEKGLIKTGNYNKLKIDKTKWYSITDFGINELQRCVQLSVLNTNKKEPNDDCQVRQLDCQNRQMRLTNSADQTDEIGRAIPNINTNINTDNNIISSASGTEAEKLKNQKLAEEFVKEAEKPKTKRTPRRKTSDDIYSPEFYRNITKVYCDSYTKMMNQAPMMPSSYKKLINKITGALLEQGLVENEQQAFEVILKAIENAKKDNWIVNEGLFSFTTIFSDKIFPKLLNDRRQTQTKIVRETFDKAMVQSNGEIDYSV